MLLSLLNTKIVIIMIKMIYRRGSVWLVEWKGIWTVSTTLDNWVLLRINKKWVNILRKLILSLIFYLIIFIVEKCTKRKSMRFSFLCSNSLRDSSPITSTWNWSEAIENKRENNRNFYWLWKKVKSLKMFPNLRNFYFK